MQNVAPHAYGILLAIDGYGASHEACADRGLLYRLLTTLPGHLDMRPLGRPHIEHVDEDGVRGLSGFTFIMESHISIHTYEERGFVTADIYSCKPFDTERAVALFADAFDFRSFERSVLVRGHRFSASPLPDESFAALRPQVRP